MLAVSLVALFLAILRRNRPPAWVVGLLMVIAYYGLSNHGVSYVKKWENEHFPHAWFGREAGQIAYLFLAQGPFQVIWFLPLGAALVEARGRKGRGWTWVEGAAFLLPVSLAVTAYVRNFFKIYHNPKRPSPDGQYVYAAMLLGSLALAMILVRALAPAWARFFATRARPTPEGAGAPGAISGPGG